MSLVEVIHDTLLESVELVLLNRGINREISNIIAKEACTEFFAKIVIKEQQYIVSQEIAMVREEIKKFGDVIGLDGDKNVNSS